MRILQFMHYKHVVVKVLLSRATTISSWQSEYSMPRYYMPRMVRSARVHFARQSQAEKKHELLI
jgi:hypothetical protein